MHSLLPAHAAEKLAESFDEHGLRLRLRLPSMYEGLGQRLRDLSRGTATLHRYEAASEWVAPTSLPASA